MAKPKANYPHVGNVSSGITAKDVLRESAAGLESSRKIVADIRSQEPRWLSNLFTRVLGEKSNSNQ